MKNIDFNSIILWLKIYRLTFFLPFREARAKEDSYIL